MARPATNPNTTTITTTSSSPSSPQWLLPSSLKLRNLQSISLRNLLLSSSSSSSTTTADDDSLPQTLHSPAKLLALKEEATTLHHAHSHSDLRRRGGGESAATEQEKEAVKRPLARRMMRRRSTMEWANATPQTRQRKLEATTRGRIGDVFFSLHVDSIEEPVYISEMVERTMNPTFRTIDWAGCGVGILRREEVVVKIWARGNEGERWMLLMQLMVHLRALRYLGKNLSALNRPLPSNALIFHLPDGVYTTSTSQFPLFTSSRRKPPPPPPTSTSSTITTTCTSTFDALLRLQKLTDTIQDALETRNQLAQDLAELLLANKHALIDRDSLSEAQDRLKTIEFAKLTVQKQLDKARAQQVQKRTSLSNRKEIISASLQSRQKSLQTIQDERPTFPSLRSQHTTLQAEIQSQRRRICSDLHSCYPIFSPNPSKPLAFTIRGLHLPHAEEPDLDSFPPEEISAALGHVAHALQLLSFYLGRGLLYSVTVRGSTSTIFDSVSLLATNGGGGGGGGNGKKGGEKVRTYPLFTKSVPRFRFEYAVFLIGWDLKVLLEEQWGIRVEDSREVLGNLKLGFVVATEGQGELVGRKVGGVRGLVRRESRDSVMSGSAAGSGHGVKMFGGNGKMKDAKERLREISISGNGGVVV